MLPAQGTQLEGGQVPAALHAAGAIPIEPVPGPDDAWDARVCAGIAYAQIAEPSIGTQPLRIIAVGDAADALPAVARANRACQRRVAEYALVEPTLPATSDAWPDATVTVFADDPSIITIAGLRGWIVRPPADFVAWLAESD